MLLLALQIFCSQKDKDIVKDYNYLRLGNTKTKAEMLQFDVDHMLDDSFLPRGNRQRKEESQRRMFDVLDKPCVENAVEGCNTTVRVFFAHSNRRAVKRFVLSSQSKERIRMDSWNICEGSMHRILKISLEFSLLRIVSFIFQACCCVIFITLVFVTSIGEETTHLTKRAFFILST